MLEVKGDIDSISSTVNLSCAIFPSFIRFFNLVEPEDKEISQETADLVTFIEEILNGKLHLLRSVSFWKHIYETLCAIWYHLYNIRKRVKLPWRSLTFSKVAGFSLQLYWKYHSSKSVFPVFWILKMLRNCSKRFIYLTITESVPYFKNALSLEGNDKSFLIYIIVIYKAEFTRCSKFFLDWIAWVPCYQ